MRAPNNDPSAGAKTASEQRSRPTVHLFPISLSWFPSPQWASRSSDSDQLYHAYSTDFPDPLRNFIPKGTSIRKASPSPKLEQAQKIRFFFGNSHEPCRSNLT